MSRIPDDIWYVVRWRLLECTTLGVIAGTLTGVLLAVWVRG